MNIYKLLLLKKAMLKACLFIGVMLWGFVSSYAQTYNLPITGTDAVRCGAGELTLSVTENSSVTDGWPEGISFNAANVKWYTVPFYGTPIATGLTYNTGYLEFSRTYYVDYTGSDGCSQCDRLIVRAVINDNSIAPQISYKQLAICNNIDQNFTPAIVGASSGIFSVNPNTGLTVNGSTGTFNPKGATAGTYTITFQPTEVIGCDSDPVSTTVTITNALIEPVISYPLASYCSSSGIVNVTRSAGAAGGTYSAYPTGLSIDPATGTITPSASATGNYIVSYTVPGTGGCSPVVGTANISIFRLPEITSISYQSPFCGSDNDLQTPVLTVENSYTPGLTPYGYTGDGTLALNTSTGEINPSLSDPGTYQVTYTIPAASPCGEVSATASVTILPVSSATISADKTSEFVDETAPIITFSGTGGPAPYTFTARIDIGNGGDLIIGNEFEITTPDAMTATKTLSQSTEVAETFTYHLIRVTDANGCSTEISGQSVTITINDIPNTTFAYQGSPYCTNGGTAVPSGNVVGSFSYSGSGLDLNTSTGVITLANSTAGTYTVTQTLSGYSSTAEVVITRLPVATFAYGSASYCPTAGDVSPSVTNDIGIFTASDPAVIFAEGVSVAPGTINTLFTPPGTYTITNTVQAGNGCSEVSASTEITINASPNYTGTRAYSICSGETTAITHSADIEGSTFSWTVSDVTGGITGASEGSGNTITQTLINPANTTVGTVSYTVTPNDATGCGIGVPTTVVVTVNPLPAKPTANSITMTYDGSEKSASASSSTITATSEAAVIAWFTTEAGTTATMAPTGTDVGTYTAWAEASYLSGCKSAGRTLVTLTIEPAELIVTDAVVADHTYDGTNNATISGATLAGVVSGDDVALVNVTSGTFAQVNADDNISVTTAMTISGTDAGNYTLTQPTLTGNIIKANLTYTANAKSKEYGEENPSLDFIYTGFVNGETPAVLTIEPVASTTVGVATEVGIHDDAITVDGGVDDNYSFTYIAADFTITKATLTVTADNIIRGVGETTPAYSYTVAGFKNGETEAGLRTGSSLSGTVTFTDNTSGSTAAGTYTITPIVSGLSATNYTFSTVNGTLTISNVVVEATEGTLRAGYTNLDAAYTAINDGTHKGDITIYLYADTSESTTATLNASGTGSTSYTSVTIVAVNGVTVTGTSDPLMILGQ